MNRVRKNNRNNKLHVNDVNISKNEIAEEKPKHSKLKKLKYIFLLTLILIIITAIKTGISISRWQNLAQDMIANTPSQVLDTDGEIIAEIGNNKKTKNVS